MSKILIVLINLGSALGGGHTGSSSSSSTTEAGSGSTDGWQQGAACYGFGGGHGVWKCGTSAAWCTEIGGVARYVEDYRSRRSGACMCEDGCTDPASIVPGFTKAGTHDGFACYNYDGTHTVACGMSKADCEGLSGYSYEPGYLSASSGCCLCDENCDHTAETGTGCTYNTAVSSPTPPPVPPSPPPSPFFPPVVGDSTDFYTVTVKLNVTGTIDDYSEAKMAMIADKFAIACAVHADDITVTFEAGSVIITVSIKVPDEAAATKVSDAIATNLPDAAAATTFLGGSYSSILYRQSVQAVMAAETVAPAGGGTTIIIIIVVVVVVVLVLVGLIAMKMMKKPAAAAKGSV